MKISKQLRLNAIVLVLFNVVFFSCEDAEEPQPKPDYEALLMESKWKFSEEVSLDAANATLVNTFLKTATLTFKTGAVLESNFFTIGTNTWVLNGDKTAIIIDQGLDSEDEWIIVSLTETELIYRDDDDDDASGGALPFSLTDGKPLELKFLH